MNKAELIAALSSYDDQCEVLFDDDGDGLEITDVEDEDGAIYLVSDEGDDEEDTLPEETK